jgi:3-(3-hydroxy-phenyl)propionate hydroxylase
LGGEMVLLALGCAAPSGLAIRVVAPALTPEIRARYLGETESALYLIRPDQVVAARWAEADAEGVAAEVAAIWEGRA